MRPTPFATVKRRVLALVTLLGLASIAGAQIQNPGFEDGNGTSASNWFQFGNAYREPVGQHSGSYAMKMFGNFTGGVNVTGAFQDFAILPGQFATTSVEALNLSTDAMSGDNFAVLKLIYRDAANNDLVASESVRIDRNTPQDQFQHLTASLGPAPAGTHHGSIFLLFIQLDSTPFAPGAVFFDDVELSIGPSTETRKPASYLITEGYDSQGDLASLFASDDNRLTFFNNELTLGTRVEITSEPTNNRSSHDITVTCEHSVARLGLAVRISLKNNVTNGFDLFSGTVASSTDVTNVLHATDPKYIDANGAITVAFAWTPINDEAPAFDGWEHLIDYVSYTIAP